MESKLLNPGYHLREIAKGKIGYPSKVREEFDEMQDALDQGVKIMALVEMADLLGALDGVVIRLTDQGYAVLPPWDGSSARMIEPDDRSFPPRALQLLDDKIHILETATAKADMLHAATCIVSALRDLLVLHGGKIQYSDLVDMAIVTRRAFLSGRRT